MRDRMRQDFDGALNCDPSGCPRMWNQAFRGPPGPSHISPRRWDGPMLFPTSGLARMTRGTQRLEAQRIPEQGQIPLMFAYVVDLKDHRHRATLRARVGGVT